MGRLGFNFVGLNKERIDRECDSVLVEDSEEENVLSKSKNPCGVDSNRKIHLCFLFFISILACFCIFVVVPQLIDHYTGNDELSTNMDQKQTLIELLDAEKSRKYQERLDILEKFDLLQRNYKIIQAEYEKAKGIYLAKLHGSYGNENISS